MAALIIVKPASVSWKGSAASGCQSATINSATEMVDDRSDGSTFRRRPAVRDTQTTITLSFVTNNGYGSFTVGDSGALIVTGKEGRGGSNPVYTVSNAIVRDKTVTMDGTGSTVTLEGYATDGTTNPVEIT